MDRKAIVAGLLPAFMLYACDRAVTDAPEADVTEVASSPVVLPSPTTGTTTSQTIAPPPGYTDGQGVNEGYPDLTPKPVAEEAEKGETGARIVLISFARAIELREYDQAWAMLGPTAKAKWSQAKFNGLFDGLAKIMVAVPTGTMEGAAGSSYYTSTATITATDQDGRPIRIEGPIVLRRVNDVAGATSEQLRWRIESVDLAWTH